MHKRIRIAHWSITLLLASTFAARTARRQAVPATAPAISVTDRPAIDSARAIIIAGMRRSRIPGASVTVLRSGKEIWSEGLGVADFENNVAVTPLTKFRIGSVSKPVTAVAMATLVEEGKLDLDAPIQKYERQMAISLSFFAGTVRLFLALIAATAGISLSDWLFFGVIFHDEYMKTPEMWRAGPESRKIAGSTLLAVFGTAAFLVLAQSTGVHGFGPAMTVAVLVWLAAALPQTVTNTLYLKYSARLGVSHSLGWLARLVIAAAAYVLIVG